MRIVVGMLALVLAACGPSGPSGDERVVVFAAASLTDAFEELADVYEGATGIDIVLSFDASSALRAQIEQGAPADLFASADVVNAEAIAEAGLAEGEPTGFATNSLTIVVPVDGPRRVGQWEDMATPSVRVVGAGADVPISRYADELIARLDELPNGPEGFADAVAANVVSREDNVRSVLAKIEIGEGDAALVYATDAAASDDVEVVAIPEGVGVSVLYAMVLLEGSSPAAGEFADWLLDSEAQEILIRYGFGSPPG